MAGTSRISIGFKMISRRAALALLSTSLALAPFTGVGPARAQPQPPLEIAIFPYYSTRMLLEQFEPMRRFVEQHLRRTVYFVTTKDFRTFIERTHQRQYPFILSAPHMSRLAQVEDGYRPMLQARVKLQASFLVDRNSPHATLQDLRGQSIGTPDPLAIITMMGEETLIAAGLNPGKDVTLKPQPTHNAAVLSVLRGENAAALAHHVVLAGMDAETRDRLRPIAKTVQLPTMTFYMASPTLAATEAEAIRDAIVAFAASPDGQDFMKRTGYDGIDPASTEDLGVFERYLPLLRRALATP